MFTRFHLFRRKPRSHAPPVTLPPALLSTATPTAQNIHRISTLSNATTLHPAQNEIIPPSLLSSFPAPPNYSSFPQQVPQAQQAQQYPHTFLPNISQSSLDTLADPLGRLPNAPNRLSTFEAFISNARAAEQARQERERYMVRAWLAAEEERRRMAARSLSDDPWRGRFGPPSSQGQQNVGLGIGMGMGVQMQMPPTRMHRVDRERVERPVERSRFSEERERPKTSASVQGVKVWLRKVTSLERLRA